MIVLDDSNWIQYAMNNYSNPHLTSVDEFNEDLKRLSSILLLLNRYSKNKNELNINLILNHIIILMNCFGVDAARNLLLYKVGDQHSSSIQTILYYLNIHSLASIEVLDEYIFNKLKEL